MKVKVKKDKLLLFSRQLNNLIKGGVSFSTALNILYEAEFDKNFKQILSKIKLNIDNGQSIFNSFKSFHYIFGNYFLYMIKIGETSGSLENSLESIYYYFEYNINNKRKIISVLIYPIIILILTFLILTFLMIFILPNFISLFEENQITLPGITKFLIFISNNFFYIIIFISCIIFFILSIFKYINKHNFYRIKKEKIFFELPIWGNLNKNLHATDFFYSLHILLNSGINLAEGLNFISKNTDNLYVRSCLNKVKKEISAGNNVSSSLKSLDFFYKRFYSFIQSSEESGYLSECFLEISKILKAEFEYSIKKYMTIIEPLSIIFLGLIIVFIVLAIYLPIFSMTDII